jgi:hypothetical protein
MMAEARKPKPIVHVYLTTSNVGGAVIEEIAGAGLIAKIEWMDDEDVWHEIPRDLPLIIHWAAGAGDQIDAHVKEWYRQREARESFAQEDVEDWVI